MRTPESLAGAVDCGVIQEVVRPLMSGKEAQVYVVVVADTECVAKVYKEASQRTFKHRAEYAEGRRTRNSRDQRAISKRSRHGRSQDEAGWRRTEVDTIQRLCEVGVSVPELINFVDGVVIMELIKDAEGNPAPRLGDLTFSSAEAREIYQRLLREVTRMLCAGVIHGDLSEFNVLMAARGPVLIDFPQAIDASHNQGARKFLLRDVDNLHRFVEQHSAGPITRPYGEEMWSLYEANRLAPETDLRGNYRAPEKKADTQEVLALIEDADREQQARREARGEVESDEAPRPLRTVVNFSQEARPRPSGGQQAARGRKASTRATPSRKVEASVKAKAAVAEGEEAGKKRRSRRRRKRIGAPREGAETISGSARVGTSAQERTGSGAPVASQRRRRGSGARSETAGARTGASKSSARSTEHDDKRRIGGRSADAAGDPTTRPSRRRRRRRRSSGSTDST